MLHPSASKHHPTGSSHARIRLMSPADVEDYRTIRLASLETNPEYFGSPLADERGRSLDDFRAAIARATVFGAYCDGQIAGVIRLHAASGIKERHKGTLNGVFVRPEHRGKGVGAELIEAALDGARATLEQVTLVVAASNLGAIALYERLGFERYGQEPRSWKFEGTYTDAILMVKMLDTVATGTPTLR